MAWDLSRDDIIKRSLRICGALAQGESPSSEMTSETSDAFNGLLKSLQNEGIVLSKLSDLTHTITASSEVVGSDALNYRCIKALTSGATTKPITGANWSTHWRQTGTAGVAWVDATAYTCAGEWNLSVDTLDVMSAFVRRDQTDYPIQIIPMKDYRLGISHKWDESNLPTTMVIDKAITPIAYIYPMPSDTDLVIHYRVQSFLSDLLTASANPDVKRNGYDMLCYALAANIGDEYDLPISRLNRYEKKADVLKLFFRAKNVEDKDGIHIRSAY